MNSKAAQPPIIASPTGGRARLFMLLSAGLTGGLVVLYFFNPVDYAFYPSCQFYQLTHLHCPGCGSLRALHQLTHGHMSAAFYSNPLLIASLPLLAWLGVRQLRRAPNHPARRSLTPSAATWIILGIVIAFGVLRNLPWKSFSWMSP